MSQSDIHLKLGDVKGESTDDKHKDEIDVLSFAWGVSNMGSTGSGGGGGTGRAVFADISFQHRVDKASPALWKVCATGEPISEGTLTAAKSGKGPQDFLIIKMKEVLVTGVSTSGAGNSGNAEIMETVTLQAASVDFEYKPQKGDGSLDAGAHFKYDMKANKEG